MPATYPERIYLGTSGGRKLIGTANPGLHGKQSLKWRYVCQSLICINLCFNGFFKNFSCFQLSFASVVCCLLGLFPWMVELPSSAWEHEGRHKLAGCHFALYVIVPLYGVAEEKSHCLLSHKCASFHKVVQ